MSFNFGKYHSYVKIAILDNESESLSSRSSNRRMSKTGRITITKLSNTSLRSNTKKSISPSFRKTKAR